MAYSINIAGHEQIVQVERSAFKWPLFPEKFSFFLLKDDGPHFYKLRRDVISIGDDYTLYDQHNRRIGWLDGKVLNLGGAWKVKVDGAHADPKLDAVLQLFCAMLKFNNDTRRHILRLSRNMRNGKIDPKLETQETDLYMNPRAMR
jgi:hypothetical protein